MGGQKGIALFYEYLSRLLPVSIISTKNNEFPGDTRIQFLPLLSNYKLRYANPFLFLKLKAILIKTRSTHLVLEHPYYGWLGLLLKWSGNIKLVVHSHNIESLRFKSTGSWWWPLLWQYEKFIHRKADINFFINDEDRDFAIKHFALDVAGCHTITYGFEINKMPLPEERMDAKKELQRHYGLHEAERILLFNGTLDYKPNTDAVDIILQQINPILLVHENFKYKIIICGKGLPSRYDELKSYTSKNIIYAGFVDDISVYFKCADIFINPVIDGGGIKTKLVEALGYNLTSVSTINGAIGVPPAVTGNKMHLVEDNGWQGFANAIFEADLAENIPTAFFDHFYWGNIAAKAAAVLSNKDYKS